MKVWHEGGKYIELSAPLDRIPVLAREGAIIPTSSLSSPSSREILIFPPQYLFGIIIIILFYFFGLVFVGYLNMKDMEVPERCMNLCFTRMMESAINSSIFIFN